MNSSSRRKPRVRQRLGKYRIERIVAEGGFATVYGARDTIEGVPVALELFRDLGTDEKSLEIFRQEARVQSRLDHPNLLPIKDANIIDGHFVIVTRLGEETLASRLAKRLSVRSAIHYADQMLEAIAYTHQQRVLHLDIKPENFILFAGDVLKLTDFGISRFALRTVQGSGSGTVGYSAPEQAMGHPSYCSDVFSIGLILWRMLSGKLPEWPFDWPPAGHERVQANLHRDFVAFLKRSIAVQAGARFADGVAMRRAFRSVSAVALRSDAARRGHRSASVSSSAATDRDWRRVRWRQFRREFGAVLDTRHTCTRCEGPVAEAMQFCPWCAKARPVHRGSTRWMRACPRCKRGLRADWRYCPHCYGSKLEPTSNREYDDERYQRRCQNSSCARGDLLPFMRYCPWCHVKVSHRWRIPESRHRCKSCGWGVLPDYWSCCPWCSKKLGG